jgi:hypothetical protein
MAFARGAVAPIIGTGAGVWRTGGNDLQDQAILRQQ